MSPRSCFRGRDRQRGAIGLVAAMTLGLALLFALLVVDSGRLYLEQRKLQRVVDTAALEAVTRGGYCQAANTAMTYATQSAARNGFSTNAERTLAIECGTLVTGNDNLRRFSVDANKSEAIRVVAHHSVPRSIASGVAALFSTEPLPSRIWLTATAVASSPSPLAMLTIRTTLGIIDSTKSELLNALVGGMLGGKLQLTAGGWDGLVNTNIKLLSYLDQLAVDVLLKAGDYETLLNTAVSPTQLIDAAIKVLSKGGATAEVAVQALQSISTISSAAQTLKLGDVLNVQTGASTAGLDSTVQVFQLVQAVAQLANSKSAAAVSTEVSIPLIGTSSIERVFISGAIAPCGIKLLCLKISSYNFTYERSMSSPT